MSATGHSRDPRAIPQHRRAVPRDAAWLEAQADHPAAWSRLFDLRQGLAADEIALVQLDCPAQPRLVGIDRLVHVVAPEAKRRLEASGVTCPEAGGEHALRPAVLEDRVPDVTHMS